MADGTPRKKPCFFKVLMPGFFEKLEIPRAFVKHIVLENHCSFTIWSPLEKECHVKIEGNFPNLYFGEGWGHFAEAHNLEVGYFLVFCYEGGTNFSVIILDTSSCEKEYAKLNPKVGVPSGIPDNDGVFVDCTNLEGTNLDSNMDVPLKTAEKNLCTEHKKASNMENDGVFIEHTIFENSNLNSRLDVPLGTTEKDPWMVHTIFEDAANMDHKILEDTAELKIRKNICDLSGLEEQSEHKKATDQKVGVPSGIPEKDGAHMERSSFEDHNSNSKVDVPLRTPEKDGVYAEHTVFEDASKQQNKRKFHDLNGIEEYLERKKAREIIARDSDYVNLKKKSNSVLKDIKVEKTHTNVESPNLADENESDCDMVTQVKSSKHNNEFQHPNGDIHDVSWTSNSRRASCNGETHATYKIVMKPHNLKGHYYLYIPVKFKEATCITQKHGLILRDQNGKSWPVEVLHSTKNRTLLVRGWKEFCISHRLRPGDECEFHLSSYSEKKMKIMEVQIFKHPKMERQEAFKVKRTCGSDISSSSFWLLISPSKLNPGSIAIPNAFSAATKLYDQNRVVLKDQQDQKFRITILKFTRKRTYLGKGWTHFVRKEKLKEGDICTFRLADKSGDRWIFNVDILRQSQ